MLSAYAAVLRTPLLPTAYRNSIFITVVGTSLSMAVTLTGAYTISRRHLPGRLGMTLFLVFTMLFYGGLIPTFLTVKAVGLLDTVWALILPTAVSVYNTMILRNFYMSIPDSLEESAVIDGARPFIVFVRIVLPLSKAAVATVSLFYAVAYWNAFFEAVIYINRRTLWPLQLLLRETLIAGRMSELFPYVDPDNLNPPTQVMELALIVVTIVPILLVYPFLQRHFAKGVLMGSLKG
jgi:putative aldouronate transport system permease protein